MGARAAGDAPPSPCCSRTPAGSGTTVQERDSSWHGAKTLTCWPHGLALPCPNGHRPQGWDGVPRAPQRRGLQQGRGRLVSAAAGSRRAPTRHPGAGGRWKRRMALEARWRPGGAHPCAHRRWRASKPRTPSPGASSFPPPATHAGFLISAPLYIQIAGAQNGNVQVSS